jgi:hypothetical protein
MVAGAGRGHKVLVQVFAQNVFRVADALPQCWAREAGAELQKVLVRALCML